MDFSTDQSAALDAFADFTESDRTIFALLGYAGTGKSFVLNPMTKQMQGQVILATPTHKACNVVRRGLRRAGVAFEEGYNHADHKQGRLITGTTAQLIGLAPVVSDDQEEGSRSFGKTSGGILGRLQGGFNWVVIDEVSMLSADHLALVEAQCMAAGAKLVVIGDPGQLPPVNAEPIDWGSIPAVAVLEQIMRQPSDSAIPLLAQAVRRNEDWRSVSGGGIAHTETAGKDFLDALQDAPEYAGTMGRIGPALEESDRDVFIAYTNRVVDEVQELACREVYGHGRHQFEPNQLVICESRIEAEVMTYVEKYGRSYPRLRTVANNADELIVKEFGEKGTWGTEVVLSRADGTTGDFGAEYLTPEERSNRNHPYNVALKAAMSQANALQTEWKKNGSKQADPLNDQRKAAWGLAFDLRDRTVISFRHPFALTSHKSQGSTYGRVFVDAQDIERFDSRGLYVAATRPAKELVIG